MCCLLVSGFLTEITQQIHSLRASGVISSHFDHAAGSEMRTSRKSAGKLCTGPAEIAFWAMRFILHRYAIRRLAEKKSGVEPLHSILEPGQIRWIFWPRHDTLGLRLIPRLCCAVPQVELLI